MSNKIVSPTAALNIELAPVQPGQEIGLINLFQLYFYDSSAWDLEDIEMDGRYDVDSGPIVDYVYDENKTAFFIIVDSKLAGFLVTEPAQLGEVAAVELADLFVMSKYRRRGVGLEVVRRILCGNETTWLVSIYRADKVATQFWKRTFARLSLLNVQPWKDPTLPQFEFFSVNMPA